MSPSKLKKNLMKSAILVAEQYFPKAVIGRICKVKIWAAIIISITAHFVTQPNP